MRIDAQRLGMEDESISTLVAWDAQSLFVRAAGAEAPIIEAGWSSVPAREAFELARRLIDRKSTDHWIWLGLLMLDAQENGLAKRAFDPAARLDQSLRAQIDEAMRLASEGLDPRGAFVTDDDDGEADSAENPNVPGQGTRPGRSTEDPQGETRRGVDGPYVWPALDEEELANHTRRLKAKCAEMIDLVNKRLALFETDHFLFYSDLSAPEARKWAGELDRMYGTLLVTLEIPKGTKLFQGKGAIFVFREREDFLRFESRAFGHNAEMAGGVNHQRSGDTFTVFYKHSNEQLFNSVLIHETVHAFMYRYRSSARLPTWANEGLADFIAGHLVRFSNEPSQHWQDARNFVAQGGDPLDIMQRTYANGRWMGADSYEVSHMLVRFMLKHKPRAFKEWIDAIKGGAEWSEALGEFFNVTPEVLAKGFSQDIMAERGHTRLD